MIRAICYYTNQEEDEPSSLREQQHQCLETVHNYGWVIHREVFAPFMKKVKIAQRSGMRTIDCICRNRWTWQALSSSLYLN